MLATESRKTILVVEDDPSIADLFSWALEDMGFTVHTTPTIAQALTVYEEAIPDLVVCDLRLPDGSGSDLVQELRRRSGQPPVATLVVSAHPRALERAQSAGADACLPKPFSLDDLYYAIDGLLDTPVD